MFYEAKNKNKFIVYNPIDQSLPEKIYNSISCFVIAMVNGWEFRINDTEGIKLVKYLTSLYPWWKEDWINIEHRGRLNLKNITNDDITFLSQNKLEDLYTEATVLHVSCDGNIIQHLMMNNNNNKQIIESFIGDNNVNIFNSVFNYLFEIETEYFNNFKYLFNTITSSPHIGIYFKNVNEDIATRLIENELKNGNKIFFSGDYNLLKKLNSKFKSKDIKSIIRENTYNDIINKENILIQLFELFIFVNLEHKIIYTEGVIKDLLIQINNGKFIYNDVNELKLVEIY